MVSVNHAANNSQNPPAALPKLHWRQWDILRYIEDDCHDEEKFVTVTPGRPPRPVQRAHDYFRTHAQIKRLVDLGLLEHVRAEIYPGGACCDIYATTAAGKAAVIAYYARSHENSRERNEAYAAKRDAQNKTLNRLALRAALEEQFGGNYYTPALHDDIIDSKTPFLDMPMPMFAPRGRDGLPISLREYLIALWYECLDDELQKTIGDFLLWGETIGYDDAAAMLRDKLDEDEDDETGGDLDRPYGRIS